jgi:REP element-mobilizing transposase RayT
MEPIYTPESTVAAYQLDWTISVFWRATPPDDSGWLDALRAATEPDGIRILKHQLKNETTSQFLISTKPPVSPRQFLRSVKGRLQHLLREKMPSAFQRNYSFRSVGSANRQVVEAYIAGQLGHHVMADDRVQSRLHRYQREYPEVDLSQPRCSAHGLYWYSLHLVLVNDGRWMEIRDEVLDELVRIVERAAAKRGHALSRLGVLPDHLHLAMGCPGEAAPQDVALGYMNNCAYVCGMKPVLRFSYYVGAFGEYDLGAV